MSRERLRRTTISISVVKSREKYTHGFLLLGGTLGLSFWHFLSDRWIILDDCGVLFKRCLIFRCILVRVRVLRFGLVLRLNLR